MGSEPNYYQILGVEPTADQAAIDAAYQGRALRFRLGQLRDRARALPGPSQEELEQAYATLGNVEARAAYDADHFPEKASARRRLPVWLWGIAAAWVAVIAVVCVLGARSRLTDDGSAIGQLVATETATSVPTIVAVIPMTETPTVAPTSVPPTSTPTQVVVPSPTVAPTPTIPPVPTATATLSSPSLTFRPTPTEEASPTATPAPTPPAAAGTQPPTATTAPPPTPVPPTATLEPTVIPEPPPPEPPPTEPPPPAPTATPTFHATDRIGTSVPVNLRSGPGTGYPTLGSLAPGTLLAATGESAYSGGYLWRRFRVADGRIGWVRDIDVLPVR